MVLSEARRRQEGPPDTDRKPIHEYTGRDRYNEWIDDYLGIKLTGAQKEIVYAIMDNQKTLVVAGNGFGKTYTMACFALAFLFCNFPASVLATSGTYRKMRRTFCKPVQKMHQDSWGLPGTYLRSPPRIEIEGYPNVFLEAASPQDPGELEGVHNEFTLGIVEEADKDAVTADHFDSLESLITDSNDKLVAIANPPKDETNVVYDLMDDPSWTLVQFSSFDSHNVRLEMDHPDPYVRDADGEVVIEKALQHPKLKPEVEAELVPGLVRLAQIRQDWQSWNVRSWPGAEEAARSHELDDLDTRWYRRRLGVISPKAADTLRPFTVDDVEAAFDRSPAMVSVTPQGLAYDVARGHGDYNAMAGVFARDLRVLKYWHGADHLENETEVRGIIDPAWSCPLAVDSIGEGSGIADHIGVFYAETQRFNAGSVAADPRQYANQWTEGLCLLGRFLRDGGAFSSERLREELLVAARVIKLEERYSGKYDTERFHATSKELVRERLGRSPDLLDAAYMAVQMAETESSGRRIPSTW